MFRELSSAQVKTNNDSMISVLHVPFMFILCRLELTSCIQPYLDHKPKLEHPQEAYVQCWCFNQTANCTSPVAIAVPAGSVPVSVP